MFNPLPNLSVARPTHTLETWSEFLECWDSPWTYRLGGELFPYQVPAASLKEVVEQGRFDPQARLWSGKPGKTLEKTDVTQEFRALPLETAMHHPVHLSLFDLSRISAPGRALEKIMDSVYKPIEASFRQRGFIWERFYPILFLSGPDCHTNYHFDPGHVLLIQLHGRKKFHCLKDPLRWCPMDVRTTCMKHPPKPDGIGPDEVITFELEPGDALWSPMLTPHWVHAYDSTSFTLSISMDGMLRT